jgi:hypothetical protein
MLINVKVSGGEPLTSVATKGRERGLISKVFIPRCRPPPPPHLLPPIPFYSCMKFSVKHDDIFIGLLLAVSTGYSLPSVICLRKNQ